MIRHVVCLTPDDAAGGDLPAVMEEIAALVDQIEGFVACAHGPNIDVEERSPGVTHLFSCDFADRAALDRYAADPRHRALGARLKAVCGSGGIVVYDMVIS